MDSSSLRKTQFIFFANILLGEKIYFGCALARNNQQPIAIVLRTLANAFNCFMK